MPISDLKHIRFDKEIQEAQALLYLAGFDPIWIDGKQDFRTNGAIKGYFKANASSTEPKTMHDLHDMLIARWGNDENFRATMRTKALEALKGNSKDGIKAAKVLLNLETDGEKLAITDVVDDKTLAVSKSLEDKIKKEQDAKQGVVQNQENLKKVINVMTDAAQVLANDKDVLTRENTKLKLENEQLKQFETKADKLVATTKKGESPSATFNAVAPGSVDEDRRLKHQFKQTGDYHKANKHDYTPVVGDVAFLKGEGGSGVFIVKVDKDGKVYGKGEDGQPELIDAERIKGYGTSSEFMKSKENSIKAKETWKANTEEVTKDGTSKIENEKDTDLTVKLDKGVPTVNV